MLKRPKNGIQAGLVGRARAVGCTRAHKILINLASCYPHAWACCSWSHALCVTCINVRRACHVAQVCASRRLIVHQPFYFHAPKPILTSFVYLACSARLIFLVTQPTFNFAKIFFFRPEPKPNFVGQQLKILSQIRRLPVIKLFRIVLSILPPNSSLRFQVMCFVVPRTKHFSILSE